MHGCRYRILDTGIVFGPPPLLTWGLCTLSAMYSQTYEDAFLQYIYVLLSFTHFLMYLFFIFRLLISMSLFCLEFFFFFFLLVSLPFCRLCESHWNVLKAALQMNVLCFAAYNDIQQSAFGLFQHDSVPIHYIGSRKGSPRNCLVEELDWPAQKVWPQHPIKHLWDELEWAHHLNLTNAHVVQWEDWCKT